MVNVLMPTRLTWCGLTVDAMAERRRSCRVAVEAEEGRRDMTASRVGKGRKE